MRTELKIEGMSCEHCVKHTRETLEGVPGVISATVSLKEKSALVDHEESVSRETLKEAVSEAGYEVL